jgi:acetyl/propionyl-CoA carboxylase alpha subunit
VTSSSAVGYGVRIADRDVAIEIAHRRPCLGLQIDGQLYAVVERPSNEYSGDGGAFELTIGGTTYRGWRYVSGNEVYVRLGARTFIVSCANAGSAAGIVTNQQHELRADMPGVVVAIHCEVGQAVANGDPLLTIESMKLQATLSASHPAVVERVHTGIETAFERGAVLVSFVQPNVAP